MDKPAKIPVGKTIKSALRRTPLRRAVMAFRHLGLRPEDVFLASYPRSGNTWIRSLISSCFFGSALTNFKDTKNDEMPIVGFHRRARPVVQGKGRLIKTHESYRSEYKRAIWIVRDPRDVLVSEYRLALRSQYFSGTLDEYANDFVSLPRIAPSNWMVHTRSWVDSPIAGTPQMLSLRFEALRAEPEKHVRSILEFLGMTPSEETVGRAIAQNSIDRIAARHATYDQSVAGQQAAAIPAINSGEAGTWRSTLSSQAVNLVCDRFGSLMEEMGYEIP